VTAGERSRDTSFSNTSGCGRITRLFSCSVPGASRNRHRPIKYHAAPEDIKGTILHLLADIDDEEWIYWCVDDKYPIQLPTDKVTSLISHAMRSPGIDGLLFCRCRALLSIPGSHSTLKKVKNLFGDVYLERKGWWQIWIHQIMRAKVLRHLFKHLPDHIPSAKEMDDLKDDVPKLPEHRLFVTEKNYAVFGESTRRGMITQNCYESIVDSGLSCRNGSSSRTANT
jgi:hypothetical protein